jgi:hypothetical protein
MTAFTAVLALAAAAAWIAARGVAARIRIYLRFACVLYATLALAIATNIAPAAQIVPPLAVAALAVGVSAMFRGKLEPAIAAVVLAGACLAGIWSAANGQSGPADVVQCLCLIAMFAAAKRGFTSARASAFYLAFAGMAFLAALCSRLADDTASASLLFSAAGLLGTALAMARGSEFLVQQRGTLGGETAIRRLR